MFLLAYNIVFILFSFGQLIGTLLAYNLVDRLGRRQLLLGGTLGLAFVFVALAVRADSTHVNFVISFCLLVRVLSSP